MFYKKLSKLLTDKSIGFEQLTKEDPCVFIRRDAHDAGDAVDAGDIPITCALKSEAQKGRKGGEPQRAL